jgi:hypothetical protein
MTLVDGKASNSLILAQRARLAMLASAGERRRSPDKSVRGTHDERW